jgi:hypothetical protein
MVEENPQGLKPTQKVKHLRREQQLAEECEFFCKEDDTPPRLKPAFILLASCGG